MDYTKKIMHCSNYWYNDGLRKAQIRDLSGAILSLRQSLQYNKGNIAARNLLGLVYYGRGEVAEALVEWIISKNLKPRDNIANEYIQRVQDSSRRLEAMDHAIQVYNQCLQLCKQGSIDMAILKLRQVIGGHPTFVKAYQLLALIYIQDGQYPKANSLLRTASKLDTTNATTLRYMHELELHRSKVPARSEKKKEKRKKKNSVEYKDGNETIIQPAYHIVKTIAGKFTIMNIIIGALIGAMIVWYLVVPSVNQSKSEKTNKQIIEYSEQINAMKAQISAMTRTLDNHRTAGSDSEAAAQNAASTSDSYENLMSASTQYNSGNYTYDVIADSLLNVNRDLLGASGQEMYDEMTGEVYPSACEIKYEAGIEALNVANYSSAIDNLSKVVRMNADYDDGGARLNLGIAYLRSGDNDNAIANFQAVVQEYPDTDYAQEATNNLNMISQSTEETQKTE